MSSDSLGVAPSAPGSRACGTEPQSVSALRAAIPNAEPVSGDRILLLLAAEAAGFPGAKIDDWPGMDVRYGYDYAVWTGESYWNPLENDGDALWLAVQCEIQIEPQRLTVVATRFTADEPFGLDYVEADLNGDGEFCPHAATRRAIVRAAAAIGAARGIGVRSTTTEGRGPQGAEPGREAARPEQE